MPREPPDPLREPRAPPRVRVAGALAAGLEPGDVEPLVADPYDPDDLARALHGADLAVFAHPEPPPTAGWQQGREADRLALAADGFARAALQAGVARLGDASGRPEVQAILAGSGLPLQTLAPVQARPLVPRAQTTPRRVQSVQRLPLPPGRDAAWLMQAYLTWLLPWVPRWLLHAQREGDTVRFLMLGGLLTILAMRREPEVCQPTREVWQVTGGRLARVQAKPARLEFRTLPGQTEALVALRDFTPRLPWWLYRATQAVIHGWTMAWFARWLRRMG